jgi:RNAse (barnase) inhibitor barstar
VLTSKPDALAVSLSIPILVYQGSESQQRVEAAMKEFRELFPAALCYARIVPVDEVVTLTLYHREDGQLKRLMLDDEQAAELDRLWDELYYVSQEPLQLVVALEQITQFATQDRPDLVPQFTALKQPIDERADKFRQQLADTEPAHWKAVLQFAERAWRRRLTDDERQSLRGLYQTLRDAEIPHEEAIRLTLARVLTSPAFLYRHEKPAAENTPAPVTDLELATRLSYFLWSSLPDDELRRAAEAGELRDSTMLVAQTRRILEDPRTRRLAIQFACQWLHVRNFDQDVEKNEKLFPEFAELRDDMYEETVRFFEDMFRKDGSILSLLDADHTFVNEALAKHYGIDGVSGSQWRRVDGVRAHGRGGILAMATVLASQSGASRTSPILRGNWVYETLLGERLPRPPAGVPVLPDEPPPQGLTDRQLIEQHSSVEACAKCHRKIDPYGFALEQYDTIGRLRPAAVDTATKLVEGQTIDGLDGLRGYLLNERRDDIVRQFCRKLLGYALGREIQLSDRPLLDTMMSDLEKNDYRFSVAVESIVLSDQFRKLRGTE